MAQHINMWREFTKPGYEGFSISLGLMRTLIHSSDEDLWQTPSDVYPSLSLTTQYCIAGLQHRAPSADVPILAGLENCAAVKLVFLGFFIGMPEIFKRPHFCS